MPEMLNIKQAIQKLKNIYPNSPICEFSLRRWEKERRFHSVRCGRKILIWWESLIAFLNGEEKGVLVDTQGDKE